jgi:hypothetical protein
MLNSFLPNKLIVEPRGNKNRNIRYTWRNSTRMEKDHFTDNVTIGFECRFDSIRVNKDITYQRQEFNLDKVWRRTTPSYQNVNWID